MAKYQVGNSVYYQALNSYGTIQAIINAEDSADLKAQGPRYEIWFQRWGLYSVCEGSLKRMKEKPNETNTVKGFAEVAEHAA